MVRISGHFAGATLEDKGEPIKLSRKEQKIIMNIHKERQPHHSTEGDDESDSRQSLGQKRGRDEYTAGYTGGKHPRYDKPSYHRTKDDCDHRYNLHDKGKKFIICNMNKHSTNECRNLIPQKMQSHKRRVDTTLTSSKATIVPTSATSRRGLSCLEPIR